jgi:hypothetical protein
MPGQSPLIPATAPGIKDPPWPGAARSLYFLENSAARPANTVNLTSTKNT